MNRLRRRGIIWSLAWLLISLLTAGMWVRSEHHEERIQWNPASDRSYFLGSYHGCIELTRQALIHNGSTPSNGARISRYGVLEVPSPATISFMAHPLQSSFAGFGRSHMRGSIRIDNSPAYVAGFDLLSIPYWCPLGLFVLIASLPMLVEVRRRMRTPAGHCTQCGYDLRASPERCPECGATAPSRSKAAAAN